MFSVDVRERVRERLVEVAAEDGDIAGAAFTGSYASGEADRWSDIDLVLGVRGETVAATAERWTAWLYEEFGALHHWDLPAPSRIIRVFLLPGWLELDLTFAPEAGFGPRGPQWRTVFGPAQPGLEHFAAPDRDTVSGLAWHHAVHARTCVERSRWWQAEHWISALREHVITLACLRLGHPTAHAKGAHLLPDEVTAPLGATLVRSLDEAELRRALAAAVTALGEELERTDPALAGRLRHTLADIAGR